MNVHSYPQPETTPEARKAMLDAQNARYARPQGVARYCHAGLHKSREDYFYYATILGINRAVNWVVARPSVDTSQVTYSGTSQGGGFGFYLCGLNKHFTKAAIFVPALTDLLGGETDGRQSGWPRIIAAQLPENREAARRHAPYFDGANFARRIAIPVRVVVGFSDTVCAPCAVYAGYNVIPAKDKAILHGVGMGHAVFPAFYKTLRAWLESK
jgi:cephalosporin-C deacetylase-like acetyl esterase